MNAGIAAVSNPDFVSGVIASQDSTLATSELAGISAFSPENYDRPATTDAEPLLAPELTMTPSRELGELWTMYRFWRKGLA